MRAEAFKKGASKYYSGKKKKYTQKAQIVINYAAAKLLSVEFASGREHDFKLFKRSGLPLAEDTCVIADKGYHGIKKLHKNSVHPVKRRKDQGFSTMQRVYNTVIIRLRFVIERVKGILKRFRILSSKYRNAPEKFLISFSLICGLYNF